MKKLALLCSSIFVSSILVFACGGSKADMGTGKRVIILGFDGMDHGLASELMAEGRMPNFARLAKEGSFSPLGTSIPPQSPVAWSNFITGMDAGGHGIYDFMHRDPLTMVPYFSTSRPEGSTKSFKIGKWQIPYSGGGMELLRRGEAFWEVLERNGIETTIMRMPANYPPTGTASRELSGMGTPDLLGSYGTFSFYTTNGLPFDDIEIGGGEVFEVFVENNTVHGELHGLDNPFLAEPEPVSVDFVAYLDPEEPVVKLVVGSEQRVLKVGEWSDWVPIEFDLIPTQTVPAMCRFYLKGVRPDFELYVTPINMDPMSPAQRISTPESYAAELAEASGRFYTQGMAEDTAAVSGGVFNMDDFIVQSKIAGEENINQYKYVLDQFEDGLLFYYFGNLDQTSHMLWRPMDPDHPSYNAETDAPYADVIKQLYEDMDEVLGYTLEHMGADTLLIAMSDHGFTSWRRAFHLNAWLRDNGYLAAIDPDLENDPGYLVNVDWSRTRAYGLGINCLYINLEGREAFGIVAPGQRRALMEEISDKLLATVDPEYGKHAIRRIYIAEDAYKDRGQLEIGPDLVIGYEDGWRCSNESSTGQVPQEVFTDNDIPWSGCHLMDPDVVPGVLLTSRPLKKPAPRLENLAAAVLAEFGIEGFPAR